MHGLINRSIQCFLRDTYGVSVWESVAAAVGLPRHGFEALMQYDDALTDGVLDGAVRRLGKPRDALLEDVGIYLVGLEPLRRLLRFGGVTYEEFLLSLDELPDRARLSVPDLDLPDLTLRAIGPGRFLLECRAENAGFGAVFAGILRAMADDYGSLALIDAAVGPHGCETIAVELLDAGYASGRSFDLARPRTA